MSPLCPPPGFPPALLPFWPLFWVQILALRAWVRSTYGKGTLYRWSVTPWGIVYIVSIEWVPGQTDGPAYLEYAARAQARISAVLDGRAFTPEYVHLQPLSLGRGVGVRGDGLSAGTTLAVTPRPLIPTPFSPGRRGLPLPET